MNYQEAIDKAMKLLRLSKSANEHEAALAASKAQEIIDRYKLDVNGLDFDTQEKQRDDESVTDFGYNDPLDSHNGGNYLEKWTIRLGSVVARSNQCRVIYCKKTGSKYGVIIKIVGRPSDVATTRYLYAFFKAEVLRLAKLNTIGHSQAYHGQFCVGVIDTLSLRLNEQHQKTVNEKRTEVAANPLALIRVNNAVAKIEKRMQDVTAFIQANMKLGRGGVASANFKTDTGGRAHGQREGQNVRMTGARGALSSGAKMIN